MNDRLTSLTRPGQLGSVYTTLSSGKSNKPLSKGTLSRPFFAQQIALNVLHVQGARLSAIKKRACVRCAPYSLEMCVPEAALNHSSLETRGQVSSPGSAWC